MRRVFNLSTCICSDTAGASRGEASKFRDLYEALTPVQKQQLRAARHRSLLRNSALRHEIYRKAPEPMATFVMLASDGR
jgi:hypothetical protein